MIALSGRGPIARVFTVEGPAGGELSVAEVERRHGEARVVAALREQARTTRGLSVVTHKSSAPVETVHAITVVVTPIVDVAAQDGLLGGGQLCPRAALKHGVVLRPRQNPAPAIDVVCAVIVARCGTVTQIRARSIAGTWCGLDAHLGPAIAIEVIHR